MNTTHIPPQGNDRPTDATYEVPRLILIGETIDVVLGPPGGGWDGPYGITEPNFEFETDARD